MREILRINSTQAHFRSSGLLLICIVITAALTASCSNGQSKTQATQILNNANLAVPSHCDINFIPKDEKIAIATQQLYKASGDTKAALGIAKDALSPSERWVGCPISTLATFWGAPDRQVTLPGKSIVYVWEMKEEPPIKGLVAALPPPITCDVSVIASDDGIIKGLTSRTVALFSNPPIVCRIDAATGPTFVSGN